MYHDDDTKLNNTGKTEYEILTKIDTGGLPPVEVNVPAKTCRAFCLPSSGQEEEQHKVISEQGKASQTSALFSNFARIGKQITAHLVTACLAARG